MQLLATGASAGHIHSADEPDNRTLHLALWGETAQGLNLQTSELLHSQQYQTYTSGHIC